MLDGSLIDSMSEYFRVDQSEFVPVTACDSLDSLFAISSENIDSTIQS